MARQLTDKQEQFCRNIVSGMTGKDSYISAYKNNSNDNTAYKESMKLLGKEEIQVRIKELRKPLEVQAQVTAQTERERIKDLLWQRIQYCIDNNDDAAIVRYTDQLNKLNGDYINITKDITEEKTAVNNLDTDTLKLIAGAG